MININHPKIHGKPPLQRSQPMKTDQNTVPEKSVSQKERANDSYIGMGKSEEADYNQNIVESTTCSFDQLCNMINDLEKDLTGKIPEIDQLQLEPEKDMSGGKRGTNGTTYDDIMSFLTKLEEGTLDEPRVDASEVDARMLGEVFDSSQPSSNYYSMTRSNVSNAVPPVFKEDLATARLELEEKNATISLLKEQLKSERKLACEKLEGQRKNDAYRLQQQEEKYKGIVRRHQKFIEQLISEKTELTEKCNSLAQRVKEIEARMQRDLKAAAERHTVELRRAKEHFAAAEKIKRERWIESRTTKIKEMTVKGLEPELRGMMEQHAEEIQRLRNLHMKELQDAELRIIRRSNQQLEQVRLELTASHERMLSSEKNILRTRYQEKLDEQENQFKAQRAKLIEELQHERETFDREQAKREAEREAGLQKLHSQHQRELEVLRQQHSNEKIALQELMKTEWEARLTEYKRQQNLRMEQVENKIRDEFSRERDRQIELAIERLEKDSRDIKLTLRQSFDCKLRSLREKFEVDLQTAMDNELLQRNKLTQTKDRLEKVQVQLQQTEGKLQEVMAELSNANEVIKRLSIEKENARRLARQEIEGEKRELEEKIASLYQEITRINSNVDTSMAQLHSRIKLIMAQKVLTIKNLTKELGNTKVKCEDLEKMLDQQRREYILKSL